MQIQKELDVVPFRYRVKEFAERIGMSSLNQTKLITAASELVRNMLKYAGGGKVAIESILKNGISSGIKLTFIDEGPGIKDIKEAMKDGFSTGKSLGMGLPGTKRTKASVFAPWPNEPYRKAPCKIFTFDLLGELE